MMSPGIILKHLAFTGSNVNPVRLDFANGLNLIYGASNTGKSFTLKAIDFMLGGSDLPDIPERSGYERIWLGIELLDKEIITLSRSVNAGSYEVYDGLVDSSEGSKLLGKMAATQKSKNSLSQFFLKYLGLHGKKLAKKVSGEKENLSLRDLIRLCLVDEKSIQSEDSPIESGEILTKIKEQRVFKLFLTGSDDSHIIQILDQNTFKTSKAVRIEVVTEMMLKVDEELQKSFPNHNELSLQNERLNASLEKIQAEFNGIQNSVSELVQEKRNLSSQIFEKSQRLEEVNLHLGRFSQLDDVYSSDIERLSSLEEAGFLLTLEERACSLCGSPEEAHVIQDIDIEKIRVAALAEITKIGLQRKELEKTVINLVNELEQLNSDLPILQTRLEDVENQIEASAPALDRSKSLLNEIISTRDHVHKGLALLDQKNEYVTRLEEYTKLKKPSKADRPDLSLPDPIAYKFCKVLGEVLQKWGFPGDHHVSFNHEFYDVLIDGKLRTNNGKGVRAVTHAAFKIAILIYCRRNNLPHPGFIVLDSPLLTYRDPIKNGKLGALTEDEKQLARTNIKSNFFKYLASLSEMGQFIVLENIDPPNDIQEIAHVETFYGEGGMERSGLF
jgi:predicted  nucleic acid-binding Zn-ribbon protein